MGKKTTRTTKITRKALDRHITQSKQSKIFDWIEEWRHRLYLSEYSFDVGFEGEPANEDDEESGLITKAEVDISHKYHRARMTFYPVMFELSDKIQEMTIVHELAHVHTEALSTAARGLTDSPAILKHLQDLTEELTDMIAIIAFASRESEKGK